MVCSWIWRLILGIEVWRGLGVGGCMVGDTPCGLGTVGWASGDDDAYAMLSLADEIMNRR